MSTPRLSIVVIAYDMARELPRTLHTLSGAYQRHVHQDDYEIIVVDNGSPVPVDPEHLRILCPNAVIHRVVDASPSPVPAINLGLSLARGGLIGVMIDGARMASPGLVATALRAAGVASAPVIGTLAFHLGPDVQMRSVANGYDQEAEDALLASIDWRQDGYELFRISVFAGSSAAGWFSVPSETNALFLPRRMWDSLGGYDAAFVSPGGGLANLDAWARACALPDTTVTMLLGEGTFHQVHGGIATNSAVSRWKQFHDEYVEIRGRPFQAPAVKPLMVGRLPPQAYASVLQSVRGGDAAAAAGGGGDPLDP